MEAGQRRLLASLAVLSRLRRRPELLLQLPCIAPMQGLRVYGLGFSSGVLNPNLRLQLPGIAPMQGCKARREALNV